MRDACVIRRFGDPVVDDNTGEETRPETVVYTGSCRVQQQPAAAGVANPGEDAQLLVRIELQLPMSAPALEVDDEVTMTASEDDPQLPGQVYYVRDLFAKTDASSRRIGVTRRTS
jgi:hypothetical protein